MLVTRTLYQLYRLLELDIIRILGFSFLASTSYIPSDAFVYFSEPNSPQLSANPNLLSFSAAAIDKIADVAVKINENVENIGARRLHTVLEILLEDISFSASERNGENLEITPEMVSEKLEKYTQSSDLSKFIL